jgi:putative ABC transport system ATP-binding protein
MEKVTLKSVTKDYYLGKTVVKALKGVSLEIGEGEFVSIAGPSGSGKTTLLNLIGCIDKPTSGDVFISGQNVVGLMEKQLDEIRARRIGFIFQDFNLIPVLSAFENVEYPLLLTKIGFSKRKEMVRSVLQEVGLLDFAKHRPNELSGGQRQRVAIARALVTNPEIVLADEPTGNLDSQTGEAIINLMLQINQQKGTTFIFSTHDSMVMKHARKVIKIHDGKISQ